MIFMIFMLGKRSFAKHTLSGDGVASGRKTSDHTDSHFAAPKPHLLGLILVFPVFTERHMRGLPFWSILSRKVWSQPCSSSHTRHRSTDA
jgi:hypothetical protein